ncbi:hypothetical protein HD806DRAFT_379112 [Xylariaceae sp. AK1471]|nr:hypothetical protein HD806DRAFT_379112 [Xylariaceae sp. AK1471]
MIGVPTDNTVVSAHKRVDALAINMGRKLDVLTALVTDLTKSVANMTPNTATNQTDLTNTVDNLANKVDRIERRLNNRSPSPGAIQNDPLNSSADEERSDTTYMRKPANVTDSKRLKDLSLNLFFEGLGSGCHLRNF